MNNQFRAIIATYGVPVNNDILTKRAAEQIAAQVQGRVIDGISVNGEEGKKFRIVSTSLEGDERQGRVIAECEAVEEDH